MPFDYDVFISYGHIDNGPVLPEKEGWVTIMHAVLKDRLSERLGREARIWRDPGLGGSESIQRQISEALASSATFVFVLTPRYVQSPSTLQELQEYVDGLPGGAAGAEQSGRLFKVRKTHVELADHPEVVREMIGYPFHDDDAPYAGWHPYDDARQQQWSDTMLDLAYQIAEVIKSDDDNPGGPEAPALAPEHRRTVYLAESSSDMSQRRDQVRRELLGYGHTVVPTDRLPVVEAELRSAVQNLVAQADIAVHLVGAGYGVVPDGTTQSLVAVQYEVAETIPRLVWIPEGTRIEDPRQAEFVDALRTTIGPARGDILETGIERFKAEVHEALRKTSPADAAADVGQDVTRVYIIRDQRDSIEAITPIRQYLFEAGYEVFASAFDGAIEDVREDHERSLGRADAILIHFGLGSELWRRQKMSEVQKSRGFLGARRKLLKPGVYLGPPPREDKRLLQTREAIVLDPSESTMEAKLDEFVASIQEALRAEQEGAG